MNRRLVRRWAIVAPLVVGHLGVLLVAAAGLAAENAAPAVKADPAAPAAVPPGKEPAEEHDARPATNHEKAEAFKAAKPEIVRQLHAKSTATRIEALRRLRDFQLVEAAKLIANAGMNDKSAEVQDAAFETLLEFGSSKTICNFLLIQTGRDLHGGKLDARTGAMLATLLLSDVPEVGKKALALIDAKMSGELVAELADQYGAHAADRSVEVLGKLTKTDAFSDHFAVRRAVVGALVGLDRLPAMGELIRMLPNLKGEVRGEVLRYLTSLTGDSLLGDNKAWAIWWQQKKDKFVLPAPGARKAIPIARNDTPSYYGLPIFAERVVFVIDISGSMIGEKLLAAKRELCSALGGLYDTSEFGIVIYNDKVGVFQPFLVPATNENKQAAVLFVQSLVASRRTASFDALEAAFVFNAEALFFLSDGAPNTGKVADPLAIVTIVTAANHNRRQSINTIGITPGPKGGPQDTFMRVLAEKNYGAYRRE